MSEEEKIAEVVPFGEVVADVIEDMFEDADETNFSMSDFNDICDTLLREEKVKWSVNSTEDEFWALIEKDGLQIIFLTQTFGEIKDFDGVVDEVCFIQEQYDAKVKGTKYE